MQSVVNQKRIRRLNHLPVAPGPVVYWMNRDMRASDNWALLHAQELAFALKRPLLVVFNLLGDFLGGGPRQFRFKTAGLQETEKVLAAHNIPFIIDFRKNRKDQPAQNLLKIFHGLKAGAVVTDFSPLKICSSWTNEISKSLQAAFIQVDAHNIVPCWEASPKKEFGAYTIRPKIHRLLPLFLEEFPLLKKQPLSLQRTVFQKLGNKNDWEKLGKEYKEGGKSHGPEVKQVSWIIPGEKAAKKTLEDFLVNRLRDFNISRNDPNTQAQSGLSPYLHFGQISAQRIALETQKYDQNIAAQEAFLEELIVRRELSDNYCFYEPDYDNPAGFPEWAQTTLAAHAADPREHIYNRDTLEKALTHDSLWNAAQKQMVNTGKMHGYMRMYWAKKILEWTPSAAEAQKIAIYLNDKYELDGRDPNGYTGIAWSIGGVHDRAWGEREIFGKIRYMSYGGCKSKFNVKNFIDSPDTNA